MLILANWKSRWVVNQERDRAQKAETWQAVKALLIPLSLFLACVISAAGSFLIVNHESLGWVLIVAAGTVIVLDFIGLIRFQNTYRAKGIMPLKSEDDPENL